MTINDIARDLIYELRDGIEAAKPEAITAAAVAAGQITEAMADEFEQNVRALQQAAALMDRIGDTIVDSIERQKDRVVSAMRDLLRAAEDAYDAVFDRIGARFSEEDIRERISDAERALAEAQQKANEAQQIVNRAPRDERAAQDAVRAAQQQLEAAQKRLAAAEEAEKADSAELVAARQRLADAEDQLAEAKIGGVSDTGYFAKQVEQARRAVAEVEKAEKEREREATRAAQEQVRAAEQAVRDAERQQEELRKRVEQARKVLEDAPEDVSDAERQLRRANLQLFEFLAAQGITPMGAGAAQTEMRKIGEAAGLTHDEMLQIAMRAVDIRNAQERVGAAEAGRFTSEQVAQMSDALATAIREAFPTALHVDGNQLAGIISVYLQGGVAP